jgi:hypothetical protein
VAAFGGDYSFGASTGQGLSPTGIEARHYLQNGHRHGSKFILFKGRLMN